MKTCRIQASSWGQFLGKTSVFVIVLLVSLILGACGPAAKPTEPPTPVTVQLSWFHNSEFIGFYVADQKGYYKDENLDVKLLPGGPTVDPMAEVLDGKAQFGVTAGDNLIRSRSKGQDAVAVASIYRESPLIIMSLAESGIGKPQDLPGKTVGVISPNMDTTWDIQFLSLLKRTGVDVATLKLIPIEDYTGANELTSGRMDAASGFFSTNEPEQAKLDQVAFNLIYYSDYGIVIYSNPIFTNGALIRDNPELVQRLVRATLKGYQYSLEHPDEVAGYPLKYDSALDPALQLASAKAQIPLIDTGQDTLGWMNEAVWQTTQDILLEQGAITAPVDLTQVYTTQFLPKP